MTPSERLRAEMKRGRKMTWMASELRTLGWGVDRSQLSRIMSGHRKVTVDEAHLICQVMGIPILSLFEGGGSLTSARHRPKMADG
jgi:transcriptional regulator with XRE-family HTH domain